MLYCDPVPCRLPGATAWQARATQNANQPHSSPFPPVGEVFDACKIDKRSSPFRKLGLSRVGNNNTGLMDQMTL